VIFGPKLVTAHTTGRFGEFFRDGHGQFGVNLLFGFLLLGPSTY